MNSFYKAAVTFKNQVDAVVWSTLTRLWLNHELYLFLDQSELAKVIYVLATSILDYCYHCTGLPLKNVQKLQLV